MHMLFLRFVLLWFYDDVLWIYALQLPLRLTHCGTVMPYDKVAYIWVNIGSGKRLLLDGTKPLPDPKLTYHQ